MKVWVWVMFFSSPGNYNAQPVLKINALSSPTNTHAYTSTYMYAYTYIYFYVTE